MTDSAVDSAIRKHRPWSAGGRVEFEIHRALLGTEVEDGAAFMLRSNSGMSFGMIAPTASVVIAMPVTALVYMRYHVGTGESLSARRPQPIGRTGRIIRDRKLGRVGIEPTT